MTHFYIDLRNSETGEVVKYHDKKTFVEDFYSQFEDEYSEGDNAMLIAKRAGFNVPDEAIEI